MDGDEASAELLPALDFPDTRKVMRALYAVALGLLLSALLAVAFIQVDVVVRAPAVVTPSGETARVQASREGLVGEIRAREGQSVERGELLVRLEDAQLRARIALLSQQEIAASAKVAKLESLLASREQAYAQQALIRKAQANEMAARLAASRARTAAERRESLAKVADAKRASTLLEGQFVARAEAENAAAAADVAQAQVEAAVASVRELERAQARLLLEKEGVQRDARVALLSDGAALESARAELQSVRGELASAKLQAAQLEVTAPRAGTVQGLAVFDVGDVVQAGATLAYVVPSNEEYVLRAEVPSDGIAFLKSSQPVRIKLDAYPFQDFGVLTGTLSQISADTSRREGASPRPETAYRVFVNVPQKAQSVSGALFTLRPGMTAVTEFVVRRERLLSALLRPLRGIADSVQR
jgi:multidrug resistance efflux pump